MILNKCHNSVWRNADAWGLKPQGEIRAGPNPVSETKQGGTQCNQTTIHSIITTAVIFSKSTTKVKSKSCFPNTILWRYIQCQDPRARRHHRRKPSISPTSRSFPIFRINIQTKLPGRTRLTAELLVGYVRNVDVFIRLSYQCAGTAATTLILDKLCSHADLLRLGISRLSHPQPPQKQFPNPICNLKRLRKLNFQAAFHFIFKNPLTKHRKCDTMCL